MNTHFQALACCGLLLLAPRVARPADQGADAGTPEPQVTPPTPPPAKAPPPPPAKPKPPPPQAQAPSAAPAPSGQWVYTDQYGWVWMPYAEAYTYVPPEGTGEPLVYLYYPTYGWAWVVAPWVWGIGPWPYFGVVGPRHFYWYRRGWWRTPSHWHYRPAPVHRGPAQHGIRPAPPRGHAGHGQHRSHGAGHHR